MTRILIAIVLGVLLGIAGAHYTQLGFWSLAPWGLAGVAVGVFASRGEALVAGAVFGFVLCLAFMIAVYTGTAPLIGRLPGFALLGLFGALCGLALSWSGARLSARVGRR